MHSVQILILFFWPSTMVFILWMLAFQTLFCLFFEWLTVFPVVVPFPQISHLRAIWYLPCLL